MEYASLRRIWSRHRECWENCSNLPLDGFPGGDLVCELTPREAEVFLLLGYGMSNRAISSLLRITERTVKYHITQVLAKLGLESRLQAGLTSYRYRQFFAGDRFPSGVASAPGSRRGR